LSKIKKALNNVSSRSRPITFFTLKSAMTFVFVTPLASPDKFHTALRAPLTPLDGETVTSNCHIYENKMRKSVVVDSDRPPRQLATIDKERWGRHAARQINIPSDIVINKGGSGIHENSSNSRTLATLTETFTASSDQEDNTLNTSSLAYIDSFEVHEGLGLQRKEVKEEEKLILETKFSVSDEEPSSPKEPSRPRGRWPTDFYRGGRSSSPVQRPLAPQPLFVSSGSGSSWDELNGPHRGVSLLDMVDSRDDEEEDGNEGDDERDPPPGLTDMKRMTLRIQQSHDLQSPTSFQESLPKFAQGPLSHLRDDSKASFMDANRAFHESYSSSGSFESPRNDSANRRANRAEYLKKKKKKEESIIEKKGLYESFKSMIYCAASSGE